MLASLPFQTIAVRPQSGLPASCHTLPGTACQPGDMLFARLLTGAAIPREELAADMAELDADSSPTPSPATDQEADTPCQGFIPQIAIAQPPLSASPAQEVTAAVTSIQMRAAPGRGAQSPPAMPGPASVNPLLQEQTGAAIISDISIRNPMPEGMAGQQQVDGRLQVAKSAAPAQHVQLQTSAFEVTGNSDRLARSLLSFANEFTAPDAPSQLPPNAFVTISRLGDEVVARPPSSAPLPPLHFASQDADHLTQQLAATSLPMREHGARLMLPHHQFGPVALGLSTVTDTAVTLSLTAADPDFLPTIQAALAERMENGRTLPERHGAQDQQAHRNPSYPPGENGAHHNGNGNSGNPQGAQQHNAALHHSNTPERMQQSSRPVGNSLQSAPERGQRFA